MNGFTAGFFDDSSIHILATEFIIFQRIIIYIILAEIGDYNIIYPESNKLFIIVDDDA